jgi:hypothetical protein
MKSVRRDSSFHLNGFLPSALNITFSRRGKKKKKPSSTDCCQLSYNYQHRRNPQVSAYIHLAAFLYLNLKFSSTSPFSHFLFASITLPTRVCLLHLLSALLSTSSLPPCDRSVLGSLYPRGPLLNDTYLFSLPQL